MPFPCHHGPSYVSHRSAGWGSGRPWILWAFPPEEQKKNDEG